LQHRKIFDNIVPVQEAIHSSQLVGEKGLVIKLDMANAFDRVKYDFIFQVMRKFRFSGEFIKWIASCIKAPWMAPLLNG
jgi:hypothetical protein